MRGKELARILGDRGARITPAYAGKRGRSGVAPKAVEDHPRLCGEKVLNIVQNFFVPGSPPPMRGKGCGRDD